MASKQKPIFAPAALELIAERFRALSEPMRLRMVMALMGEERSVSELVEELGTTQANISKHLQLLAGAGILGRRKEGLKVYYSVIDPSIARLCDVVCGSLRDQHAGRAGLFKGLGK
jgi:DNA-binding transcriptional ArsR family regulator